MRWKFPLLLRLPFFRHGAILSVGAIFHDSIGHIAPIKSRLPVKPGKAFEAIGGSAYNVAANINQSENSWMLGASVFAVVSPNTFFERLLRAKLRRLPWETSHRVQYYNALTDSQGGKHHVKGSYYISVVNHRVPSTQAGVVDHSLGLIDLFDTKECGAALRRAIAVSSAIIASASMKVEQLDKIISECSGGETRPKRPLFVTISSSYEGGSLRANRPDKVKCISVRYEVARNILAGWEHNLYGDVLQNAVIDRRQLNIEEATTLCDLFSAEHLLVTHLTEGANQFGFVVPKGAVLVLNREHGARLIDLDETLGNPIEGNLVGVSDAIMAGFIEAYVDLASRDIFPLEDLSINVAEKESFLMERMIPHLMRVLQSNGPTLGSVLNPDKRSAAAQGFKWFAEYLREQVIDQVKHIALYTALASLILLLISFGFFGDGIRAKLCEPEPSNRLLYAVCKSLEKSERTP